MGFKLTPWLAASTIVAGALPSLQGPAWADEAAPRVEITGSAIKRVDAEGPVPVEVVTRRQIERSGAATINELIRSIASIDVFDHGELAPNSPTGAGTTHLALRGLASSNLLVLLNGRRLPPNALHDSAGTGVAVDVNMIPVSAIERIEVLKDGASAIYGADAVAGVVNFITKTDFAGLEARIGYGRSSRGDGAERPFGLVGGFGDLAKDRFNILASIDFFRRDPILRRDRDDSRSSDFRRFGGIDARSTFAPTGNIVDPGSGNFVGQTYKPCPAQSFHDFCRYDFNASVLTAINGADRISALVIGSAQLTPGTRAFAELSYSRSRDRFETHPVLDYFSVPLIDPSQQPYEDPNNPGTVLIAGRFMQGGLRTTERWSTLHRVVVGAEGSHRGLDWKLSAGRGVSRVRNEDRNYYDADLWIPAVAGGRLDPTVASNDPVFVESLKVQPLRTGRYALDQVHAQVSGDLARLPAGVVRYALGASVLRDSLTDSPDALTQAGKVIGNIAQAAVDASRIDRALFAELQLPLHESIEAQVALRHDRYSTLSATSPKLALKLRPGPRFAVRASYSRSFKAPALKQLYGAQEQGAATITKAEDCIALGAQPGCTLNAFTVSGSNPGLKPEQGRTYDIGLVFEPVPAVSATFDWWRIRKTDDIATPTPSAAIRQGLFQRQGARFLVFTTLQNVAERETAGFDLDARVRLGSTPVGNVTVHNLLTRYTTNKRRDSPGDPLVEYSGSYALPKWRNVFTVSVEQGVWALAANLRSVGGFRDTDDPVAEPNPRSVGPEEELDVQLQYTGIDGLTLTAGVKNLFDRMPPFSATNASDNTYTSLGFAELYHNRGRFWYVSLRYKFW